MQRATAAALVTVFVAFTAQAEEPIDWDMVNKIRAEGFQRSQVMDTLQHLTDRIGPRLTGSPAMKKANDWTKWQLEDWGLQNAHLDSWGPFGRGWSFDRISVHMLSPRKTPLLALPKAWTPGTRKKVKGLAIHAVLEEDKDLEKHKGKLKDKIVFIAKSRDLEDPTAPKFIRYSDDQLYDIVDFPIREPRGFAERRKRIKKSIKFRKALNEFLAEEKALVVVDISSRDGGTIRLSSAGSREPGENVGVPTIAMMAEHYNWVLRLLEDDVEVEVEIDVKAKFYDDDLLGYNTIAEIPGSGVEEEVVMVGGHLDSWHAGAGSNDNAAGCAVAMEAVRILQALGIEPKRTIRIALWSGEEQGLWGSIEYVREHFASPPKTDDETEKKMSPLLWKKQFPLEIKPGHEKLSAYFNLDNGSGRIRGVYTQENAAASPIFEAWLRPFHDLGADTVTNRNTGGTDHLPFDAVGLPGFQFIQDGLDYRSQTHHTNLDTYDHSRAEDLKQASVVMASFLYHAAQRDERFPREPMPQPPVEDAEDDEEEDDRIQNGRHGGRPL
ncbi:MAG: M20/M25/M40 family metallo-hydrolase [Thermoanaerobaculia bacterium]